MLILRRLRGSRGLQSLVEQELPLPLLLLLLLLQLQSRFVLLANIRKNLELERRQRGNARRRQLPEEGSKRVCGRGGIRGVGAGGAVGGGAVVGVGGGGGGGAGGVAAAGVGGAGGGGGGGGGGGVPMGMDDPIDAARMWRWIGFLQMPGAFHPPVGGGVITKRQFLQVCRDRKNVAIWRQTAVQRAGLTPQQAMGMAT